LGQGDGKRPSVMGDWLGRYPSMELLDLKPSEIYLDAGCGEGTIPTSIGAKLVGSENTYAIDRSSSMLDRARINPNLQGINFTEGSIQELPYSDNMFDAISCIAVLIHSNPEEFAKFLNESQRVLKPKGRLVIGLMAQELYLPTSPNVIGTAKWSKLKLLDQEYNPSIPQIYEEDYVNSNQEVFKSKVWCYPDSIVIEMMKAARLEVQKINKTLVTSKSLSKSGFESNDPIGYIAFTQILATKP
jgi:ubiquinone/menaquinone biosynthesis C-methylase UbiE